MKVGIVGLGLIGGSMAKSVKARTEHTVYGIDLDQETMTLARLCGAIDGRLDGETLPRCDLVLVALRPQAAIQWVRENGEKIAKTAILVDLCGVKRVVVEQLTPLAEGYGFAYIGGHPMAGEERGAAALLGGPVQVEARGGEVYRCFNGSGSIQFHSDGSFSAQLEASAFPLGEDRAAGALALLERLGIQGELLEEEGGALTFRQFWDGVPLFDQQVTLICQGEGAAILSGRRLAGPPAVDTSRRTITIATGLIGFLNGGGALGDVCNQATRARPPCPGP